MSVRRPPWKPSAATVAKFAAALAAAQVDGEGRGLLDLERELWTARSKVTRARQRSERHTRELARMLQRALRRGLRAHDPLTIHVDCHRWQAPESEPPTDRAIRVTIRVEVRYATLELHRYIRDARHVANIVRAADAGLYGLTGAEHNELLTLRLRYEQACRELAALREGARA